ncbi:hypothetical protein [Paenibacillus typhae]|uniref:hypothetical protein n=1 Tax=Paenibacillus typhae TaxID=1174501 RepID=UPI001C8D2F23|nr:hypothetical protein [Paenibacillus typhae]
MDNLWTNEKQPDGVGAADCNFEKMNLSSVYQGLEEKAMKSADREKFVIVGTCADKYCRRVILAGQPVVRYGNALCCNYTCLNHYMFGGARRG